MPGRDPCQSIQELLATMHALRAPGGCPWDAEQTPESLAPYLLEEACETIEAIETGSPQAVVDELGDLLLQIVFLAEIFNERGQFDFADVATAINTKLIRRHPHVFAGIATRSMDDLTRQWESIKLSEQVGQRHPLGQLPGNLPALQRAQKLVRRALRAEVELDRLLPAPAIGHTEIEQQLVQGLLSLVKMAERNGIDAEQTLRQAVRTILAEITPERAPTPL